MAAAQPAIPQPASGGESNRRGFLDDHQGNASSMRLMSFTALLAAIAFGVITLYKFQSAPSADGLYLTTAFLIAAFAPKALQKFAEANFPKSK